MEIHCCCPRTPPEKRGAPDICLSVCLMLDCVQFGQTGCVSVRFNLDKGNKEFSCGCKNDHHKGVGLPLRCRAACEARFFVQNNQPLALALINFYRVHGKCSTWNILLYFLISKIVKIYFHKFQILLAIQNARVYTVGKRLLEVSFQRKQYLWRV